ncbi:MAG: hypothetical protein P4L87_26020 [Formivibrio sp.]|nr:hypothetical protein [Formivibrio sp.]
MKFIIHVSVHALTQAWLAAFAGQSKADQHYDPVASAPRGPLLSILTSAY